MFTNQEELTQFAQKNIAQGFKVSQALFKGTEQLLQLQLNYIQQNLEEQERFVKSFNATTIVDDLTALQKTRLQRITETNKEAFQVANALQQAIQQITLETQQAIQKDIESAATDFSPAAYYHPAFVKKTWEQVWANTVSAFNTANRFSQSATEETKKSQASTASTFSGKTKE